MKQKIEDQDPEGQALADLMAAMGSIRQGRVKGLGAPAAPPPPAAAGTERLYIPPGVLPTEGLGRDLGVGGGEMEMPAGMDPRLAEIIRKKKNGAAA